MRVLRRIWTTVRAMTGLLAGWTLGWVLIGIFASVVLIGIFLALGVVPDTGLALLCAIPCVYWIWKAWIRPLLVWLRSRLGLNA